MAGDITEAGASYSQGVGLIFVFNLIVGTGALTMPYAFSQSGWLLSLIFVIALAFMSYMTVTFVIETMAAANAVLRHRAAEKIRQNQLLQGGGLLCDSLEDYERQPLLTCATRIRGNGSIQSDARAADVYQTDYYDIAARVELGQMASLFFNKVGVNLFYICLAIYLYGDLAIYAAAVPKSLRDAVCTYQGVNDSFCNPNRTVQDSDLCWEGVESVDRMNAYRIFVAVFSLLLGPFFFFNVQKTKYLQYFTTVMRWFAFITMITLAVIRLASGKGQGRPVVANFAGIPSLFGICIYSFMCHHSLPSLVTPIKNKSRLSTLFGGDYLLILGFYALLSFTGIFAFDKLKDLYTLNFEPNRCEAIIDPITTVVPIQYILTLFPVFTLSTNFPIIGVTLRNNLRTLFYREDHPYPLAVDRFVFPLLALLPPVVIALATADLDELVAITGSYAGAGVQYFIPLFLVYCARKDTSARFSDGVKNKHASPFRHTAWLVIVFLWATAAVVLVTVNHIITKS
ncbi:transmembrane protein 104-like isoform X2 [Lineus longissimus]|uniref:transmembrane protein 104-like isoform X2 n=1 Tax=Lineus longissimus TaxID=88925 RepID=UPI00315C9474